MKLSIIIPLLNEAESIRELYESLVNVLSQNNYDFEVIFIDDGSSDNSVEIIKIIISNDSKIHLIEFRKNFGKAMALQAGFRFCEGDIVITMDADLQDDPNEIPNFIAKLEEGYDLVSGWKYHRFDSAEKRLPSKLFNKITSLLTGVSLHDFNCGFKAYRKKVIDSIDVYGELHRYIPALAHRYGFRITEIAVNHKARLYGKSKYGFERYLRGLFDSVSVSFLLKYHNKPMYMFGKLGLVLLTIGFMICSYLTVEWFQGVPIGTRPLLLLGVLFMILGVQFFSSGLIADLVVDATYRDRYNTNHIKEIVTRRQNSS